MIALLKGTIFKKLDRAIILDTGNIGYLVHLPSRIAETLSLNEQATLFIHSNIREDAFDLYGFTNHDELDFFRQLISISGIGPKVASEILNSPIDNVKNAILSEDFKMLSLIPGIGQKTAKRLILELKGKVITTDLDRTVGGLSKPQTLSDLHEDAISALERLGYNKPQILKSIEKMPPELEKAEDIITYFLKHA